MYERKKYSFLILTKRLIEHCKLLSIFTKVEKNFKKLQKMKKKGTFKVNEVMK